MIEGAIEIWRDHLRQWRPPGFGSSDGVCFLCTTSPLASAAGLDQWPHDAVHVLVWQLTLAAQRERTRLDDEYVAMLDAEVLGETRWQREVRLIAFDQHSLRLVQNEVIDSVPELHGLLDRLVSPHIDAWVGRSLGRALQRLGDDLRG